MSSRAPIGYLAISNNFCTNQGCKSFVFNDNNSTSFFYYQLLSNVAKLKQIGEGTTFAEVSKKQLESFEILHPKDIKEQQKIAKILTSVDESIEVTNKIIAKQKRVKTALMQDLLTRGIDENVNIRSEETHEFKDSVLGRIPKEWETKSLYEIGECKNGLTYSPDDIVENNGLLVLRSSNIVGNKLSFHDNVFVRKDIKLNYKIKKDDILICVRNGSKTLIGKNALITSNLEGMAHGAFMTIFHSNINKYVFQLFQSDMFFNQVDKNIGATINSINNSDLELFIFSFPKSKKEQEKITDILSKQDEAIEQEEQKLQKLQRVKKALMQDLLTGKVRVNYE